jgi:hypothetical protein
MVEVTSPPASQAPRNSKITAIIIAYLMVIALEPTDVPMALATSLAPTPQAMKKPKRQARMIKVFACSAMIDIGDVILCGCQVERASPGLAGQTSTGQ